jgi:hypothetical protein
MLPLKQSQERSPSGQYLGYLFGLALGGPFTFLYVRDSACDAGRIIFPIFTKLSHGATQNGAGLIEFPRTRF